MFTLSCACFVRVTSRPVIVLPSVKLGEDGDAAVPLSEGARGLRCM